MKAKQPSFWCIANIGDVDPMLHGGKFILIDRNGIYNPVMLVIEPQESEPSWEDPETYKEYVVELAPLICASKLSLSDNKFYPNVEAWFGSTESLESVAKCAGITIQELMSKFLSSCPLDRAFAYSEVAGYYGIENFDDSPHKMKHEEAKKLCDHWLCQSKESESWHDGYGVNQ